jgi:pimeloyl-ACP methyl ester carboxylesterase
MSLLGTLTSKAILTPLRLPFTLPPRLPHRPTRFEGEGGISLHGWVFERKPEWVGQKPHAPRGWLVYLHGWSSNRFQASWVAKHFCPLGWNVLAYDSRAHGKSGGDHCTYGFYEKHDLRRALDAHGIDEALVFGTSLGASVALQAAPSEPRVRGIIAHAPFVDLRSAIADRSGPVPKKWIQAGITHAQREARFDVDAVSPLVAAASIRVPVLLVHGSDDPWTPPWHSERILDALAGPKERYLVDGAGHDGVLWRKDAWARMVDWSERVFAPQARGQHRHQQQRSDDSQSSQT